MCTHLTLILWLLGNMIVRIYFIIVSTEGTEFRWSRRQSYKIRRYRIRTSWDNSKTTVDYYISLSGYCLSTIILSYMYCGGQLFSRPENVVACLFYSERKPWIRMPKNSKYVCITQQYYPTALHCDDIVSATDIFIYFTTDREACWCISSHWRKDKIREITSNTQKLSTHHLRVIYSCFLYCRRAAKTRWDVIPPNHRTTYNT